MRPLRQRDRDGLGALLGTFGRSPDGKMITPGREKKEPESPTTDSLAEMLKSHWLILATTNPEKFFAQYEELAGKPFAEEVIVSFLRSLQGNDALREKLKTLHRERWDEIIMIAGSQI